MTAITANNTEFEFEGGEAPMDMVAISFGPAKTPEGEVLGREFLMSLGVLIFGPWGTARNSPTIVQQ